MKNYFTYLPELESVPACGLVVTAAGYTHVQPGQAYPPARHPVDHHLTWERGRVIDAHQLVLISEGAGSFESGKPGAATPIVAGDVFLLRPGLWHRYKPDPGVGWVEHWLECRGPALATLHEAGQLRADPPVRRGIDLPLMQQGFASLHRWARDPQEGHALALATLALHLYALLEVPSRSVVSGGVSRLDRIIQQARDAIAERAHEPLCMEELAEGYALSYSHFRRAFRQRVGVAPKQYHVQMRLRRARELLAGTDMSMQQIADTLGFDTVFHLSKQFKQHVGVPPSRWRKG